MQFCIVLLQFVASIYELLSVQFCMACSLTEFAYWAVLLYVAYKILDRLVRVPKIGALSNRYILVTGCDTGFGYEIAKRLDNKGCSVFAGCFTETGETNLRKECSTRLKTVSMNVANHDSVTKAYSKVKEMLPSGNGKCYDHPWYGPIRTTLAIRMDCIFLVFECSLAHSNKTLLLYLGKPHLVHSGKSFRQVYKNFHFTKYTDHFAIFCFLLFCFASVYRLHLSQNVCSLIANVLYVSVSVLSVVGLWGIINNAGIAGKIGPAEWLQLKDYDEVRPTNLSIFVAFNNNRN